MRHKRWSPAMLVGACTLVVVQFVLPVAVQGSVVSNWQSTATNVGISNITWLSCSGARQCDAYGDNKVAAEVGGIWTKAAPITTLPSGSTIGAITCPQPLDCVVGGSIGGQSFLAIEMNGIWSPAQLIDGTATYSENSGPITATFTSSITAISCTLPTVCTAAGSYRVALSPSRWTYGGPGFVTHLSSGAWTKASMLSGVDGVTAIHCSDATTCVLVGESTNFNINRYYPVVTNTAVATNEVGGSWSIPTDIPGLTKLGGRSGWIDSVVSALSCVSATACTVSGSALYAPNFDGNPASLYNASNHGYVASEVAGTWLQAHELGTMTNVSKLACSTRTMCVAGDGTLIATETSAGWGTSRKIVIANHALTFGALACSSNGPCVAAGISGSRAYATSEKTTSWSTPVRLATLTAVAGASCPTSSSCTVGGGNVVLSQR